MSYTKGEWHACQDGKCSCKEVWSDNHPVAKVHAGKWGDDYPSIRLVGETSLGLKAEPYMEQITYGEIPEEVAIANAHLIAAAPSMYEALKEAQTYIARCELFKKTTERTPLENRIIAVLSKAEGK